MEKMKIITIPDGQEKIEKNAFRWHRSLQSINIPDSVRIIGKNAFYQCVNLQSVIIPDSVTVIEKNAFYYCANLKSVTMSNNLESIGDYAFYWCKSLTEIFLPDSLADIGNNAFYWCRKLTVCCPESQKLVEAYCMKNKIKLQYIQQNSNSTQVTAVPEIEERVNTFINDIDSFENSIADVVFSRDLNDIKSILTKIMILLKEEKDIERRSRYLRNFVNYYFPTIKKLLDTFQQIETQNLNGENALETKNRIAKSIPFIKKAFEKELDNIYHNKMLDIATDIDVLEAMFAKEGLLNSMNSFEAKTKT